MKPQEAHALSGPGWYQHVSKSLLRSRDVNWKPEDGFSPAGSWFMWALLPSHGQTLNSSPPRRCEPAQHNTPATNPLSPFYSGNSGPTINEVPKLLPYEEDSKELEALRSCWLSLPSVSHQLWEYFSVVELGQTDTPRDDRKSYKRQSG